MGLSLARDLLFVLFFVVGLTGCSEPTDPNRETRVITGPAVGTEADGTKCFLTDPVTVGRFVFEKLPPDESASDNQIGMTDGNAFVAVDPRQKGVIAQLEQAGFEEIDLDSLSQCSFVQERDMEGPQPPAQDMGSR